MLYLNFTKAPFYSPIPFISDTIAQDAAALTLQQQKPDHLSVKRLTDNKSCSHHTELKVNLLFLSPNLNLRALTLQKNEAVLSVKLFTNHLSLTQLYKMEDGRC